MAEEFRSESRAVLGLWVGALAAIRQWGARLRERTVPVAGDGVSGLAAAAVSAVAALAIAGTIIAQSIAGGPQIAEAGEPSPEGAAGSSSASRTSGVLVLRGAAAGATAADVPMVQARIDLGAGGVDGAADVGRDDERVDVVGSVSGWLGPAEPFVDDLQVGMECDQNSLVLSTTCTIVKLIPPPPENA
ncbi:MAG TPA: hypothetical protein VGB83_05775 [Actinomycetota bacterium]